MANYDDIVKALKENYSSPNGEDIFVVDLPSNDSNAIEKVILLTSVSPDKPRYWEGQQYENGKLVSDKKTRFAEPPDSIANRIAGEEDDFHVKLIIADSKKNIRNMVPIFNDPDVSLDESMGYVVLEMTSNSRIEANIVYYILQNLGKFSDKFKNSQRVDFFRRHGCGIYLGLDRSQITFEDLVLSKILRDSDEYEESDLPILKECFEKGLNLEITEWKLADGTIMKQSEFYRDDFLFLVLNSKDKLEMCAHFWTIPFQGYNVTMIGSTKNESILNY